MSGPPVICARCRNTSPPGTQYCPVCGEPVDPQLVTTLRWLYTSLGDLDGRIAKGEGSRTLTQLRDDYRERYLKLRATAPVATQQTPIAPATSAVAPPRQATAPWPTPAPAAAPVASVPVAAAAVPPAAPLPSAPRQVFSWRAFLAEQAIAIMAYMGGFLLLLATLSFEIGGWQALSLEIKLGAVCAVYAIFGLLGVTFRRSERLRTVGGAYLAIFALLTPLLALGIYRFGLQAAGFSAAGMLCLSAFYAAIIYLTLAWHTRFLTYAYLGWTGVVVGAIAAVFWAVAPNPAWLFALILATLVLLSPQLLRRFAPFTLLEPPATLLASITTTVAIAGVEIYALYLLVLALLNETGHDSAGLAAFTFAALFVVPLAFAWSFTLRRILPRSAMTNAFSPLVSFSDWAIAATFAQASLVVGAWAGFDLPTTATLLGGLTIVETVAVVALRARAPQRLGLRAAITWLAVTLATIGSLLVVASPAPNWSLILVLTAGLVATAAVAIVEREPLWLFATGIFLLFDYHVLLVALLPASALDQRPYTLENLWFSLLSYHTLLIVALCLVAVVLSGRGFGRRLTLTIYSVALLDSLFVSLMLVGKDPTYATLVLTAFALLALLAGVRERQPLVGNLFVAFFGLLATLPFTVSRETDGVGVALVALIPAVGSLIIRRTLGSNWSYAPYVIAFWATIAASSHLILTPDISTRAWSFLGVSFAGALLLAVAALALVAALWERYAWTMAVPAFLAFIALSVSRSGLAEAGLVLAFVAVGSVLRVLRGRWWNVAWLGTALLGSVVAVPGLSDLGPDAPNWQVAFLLTFAVVSYLVAVQERQALLTAIAPIYALVAILLLPGPDNLIPTLVIFFAIAVISVAIERRSGWQWTLALYVIEIGASLFAIGRVASYEAGFVEALILVLGATIYAQAVIARQPLLAIALPFYALFAAVAQPDAHALLPLTLLLTACGLAIGRTGGWRWSWPFYAGALLAACVTALQSLREPGFEALALLALAVVAYLVAAVESRPDALPLAFFIGAFALTAGLGWGELPAWVAILAFVALGWLYTLGEWLWRAIPWLRATPQGAWWSNVFADPTQRATLGDPRTAGVWVHRIAGLIVALGVVSITALFPDAFSPHGPATQSEAIALVATAAMLVFASRVNQLYILRYVAGGLAALAITWELRWLGADNIQAFIIAPGSYLLIVGALLPADARLKNPARLGQWISLGGALALMLPTLTQSFTDSQAWIYASVLACEALVITAAGVGTRSRLLVLTGTGFVGLAAIRGALLAFDSGVPVALIIAAIAVLLLGGATWLSLRARREPGVVR